MTLVGTKTLDPEAIVAVLGNYRHDADPLEEQFAHALARHIVVAHQYRPYSMIGAMEFMDVVRTGILAFRAGAEPIGGQPVDPELAGKDDAFYEALEADYTDRLALQFFEERDVLVARTTSRSLYAGAELPQMGELMDL